MNTGLLNETWIAGISCFGISTGIASVLLWKPLNKMQNNNVETKSQSSDLIGYEFVLQQDMSLMNTGHHRYSGVDWKVELDVSASVDNLSAGQRVAVVSVDAGIFRVKPI